MRELHDKSIQMSMQLLGESKEEFTHYNNYLSHYSRELIHFWRSTFQEQEYEIVQKSRTLLYEGKDSLAALSHRTSAELQGLVQQEGSSRERIVFGNQEELLALLNPLKILESGYTISTIDDEDVKNRTVKPGDEMKTLANNYLITSKVVSTKEIKHENNG